MCPQSVARENAPDIVNQTCGCSVARERHVVHQTAHNTAALTSNGIYFLKHSSIREIGEDRASVATCRQVTIDRNEPRDEPRYIGFTLHPVPKEMKNSRSSNRLKELLDIHFDSG
jgi:hypothetical protein